MAKKKAGQQQEFLDPENGEGWGDDVPEAVQDAVEEYVKQLRATNKAREKANSAKDTCIAVMKEHGIERVRIDEGGKWLICKDEPKLKTEKIKQQDEAA